MTTTTALAGHGETYRVTFGRVVRSEWTKLRSLRSTWITLGAAALLTVGLAGGFGYGYGQSVDAGEAEATVARAVDAAFLGLDLFGLVLVVVGVLQMSGEYGSGLIRASLAAVPRRLPVLGAKALVLLAVTVPVALVTCLASFLVCQAVAGSDGAALGDPGVAGAILGAAAYPVALGLMGLGFGALLRHTAGAISTYVGLLMIGPALLPALLSEHWEETIMPYVPVIAGQQMYALHDSGASETLTATFEPLSRGASGAVLAGWVFLVLVGGAVLLRRRDA